MASSRVYRAVQGGDSPSPLAQAATQPQASFADLSALALAGALVTARTESRPTRQVLRIEELLHVQPEMCCAFTSSTSNCPSRRFHTGFQYTPVDSSATCVTPLARSQSLNSNSSRVNVPNSRVCRRRPVAHTTHAVTVFL